jgi:hypothetical protein
MAEENNGGEPGSGEESVELAAFQSEVADAGQKAERTVLRVEEQLNMLWTGVRGCCAQGRITNEVEAQFRTWLSRQVTRRPDRVVRQYGYEGGRVNCRQSDGGMLGADTCSGSVVVRAFVEFY